MNNSWHFLREFESKDLIKQYIKKKYDYSVNSEKAWEISASFKQGRSYFQSAKDSDISVKPLLLYYGVVAISRGLILILNKNSRENSIKPSHGLKIINWASVLETKKLENIKIKTSSGTFTELIQATKNISYFRTNSNQVTWNAEFDIVHENFEISLRELSYSFPDLKKTVESWLGSLVPSSSIDNFENFDGKTEILVQDIDFIEEIFPRNQFPNANITQDGHYNILTYESENWPHLTQKWEGSFQDIGSMYVHPPFTNGILLNDISKMFATIFVLGTISRYHPTTWMNITTGIENDRILPFAINFMDFVQENFPTMVLDFINAPYE